MQVPSKRNSKRKSKPDEANDEFYIPLGGNNIKKKTNNNTKGKSSSARSTSSSQKKKVKFDGENNEINDDDVIIEDEPASSLSLNLPSYVSVETPQFLSNWTTFFDTVYNLMSKVTNEKNDNFKKSIDIIMGALLSLKRKSGQTVDNKTNWNISNDSIKHITAGCLLLARVYPHLFLHPAVLYELSSWLVCNAIHVTKFRNFSVNNSFLALYSANLLYLTLNDELCWPPFLLKLLVDDTDRVWSYNMASVEFVSQLISGFETTLPHPEYYRQLTKMIYPTTSTGNDASNNDDDRYFIELCNYYHKFSGRPSNNPKNIDKNVTCAFRSRFYPSYDWRSHSSDNGLFDFNRRVKETVLAAINKDRSSVNHGNGPNNSAPVASTRKLLSSTGLQTVTSDFALNGGRNRQFLALITCGIPEVRQSVSECLDLWLNNPRSTRMAICILVTLLECTGFDCYNQLIDTEIFSNILRMKITSGDIVNMVVNTICMHMLSKNSELIITMLHVICSNEITAISVDYESNDNTWNHHHNSLYMSTKIIYMIFDTQPDVLNEFFSLVWHHQLMSCKTFLNNCALYQQLIGLFLKLTSHPNFDIVSFVVSILELIKSDAIASSSCDKETVEFKSGNLKDDSSAVIKQVGSQSSTLTSTIAFDGTVLEMLLDQVLHYILLHAALFVQSIIDIDSQNNNLKKVKALYSQIFEQIYTNSNPNNRMIGYGMSEVQSLVLEFLKLPISFESRRQSDLMTDYVNLLVEKLLFINGGKHFYYGLLKDSLKNDCYIHLALYTLSLNLFIYKLIDDNANQPIYAVFDGLYELASQSNIMLSLFVPVLNNLCEELLLVVCTDYNSSNAGDARSKIFNRLNEFGTFFLDNDYIAKVVETSYYDDEFFLSCTSEEKYSMQNLGFGFNFIRHDNYWNLQQLLLLMSLAFPCSIGGHVWLMFREFRGVVIAYLTDLFEKNRHLSHNQDESGHGKQNKEPLSFSPPPPSTPEQRSCIIPQYMLALFEDFVQACEKNNIDVPDLFINSISSIKSDQHFSSADTVYHIVDIGSNFFEVPFCEYERFRVLGNRNEIKRLLCECKEPDYLSEYLRDLYNLKPYHSFNEFRTSLSFLPHYVEVNAHQLSSICSAALVYYLLYQSPASSSPSDDNSQLVNSIYESLGLIIADVIQNQNNYLDNLNNVSVDYNIETAASNAGMALNKLLQHIVNIPVVDVQNKLIYVVCNLFTVVSQHVAINSGSDALSLSLPDECVARYLFCMNSSNGFHFVTVVLNLLKHVSECVVVSTALYVVGLILKELGAEIVNQQDVLVALCDLLGHRHELMRGMASDTHVSHALSIFMQLITKNQTVVLQGDLNSADFTRVRKLLLSYLTLLNVIQSTNQTNLASTIQNPITTDHAFQIIDNFFVMLLKVDFPICLIRLLFESTDIIHLSSGLTSSVYPIELLLDFIQRAYHGSVNKQLQLAYSLLWYSYGNQIGFMNVVIDFIYSRLVQLVVVLDTGNLTNDSCDNEHLGITTYDLVTNIYDSLMLYCETELYPCLNIDILNQKFGLVRSRLHNLKDYATKHAGDGATSILSSNVGEVSLIHYEADIGSNLQCTPLYSICDEDIKILCDIVSNKQPLINDESSIYNNRNHSGIVDSTGASFHGSSLVPTTRPTSRLSSIVMTTLEHSHGKLPDSMVLSILSSCDLTNELVTKTRFDIINRVVSCVINDIEEQSLSLTVIGNIFCTYESLSVHSSLWMDDDLDKQTKIIHILKECSSVSLQCIIAHLIKLLVSELMAITHLQYSNIGLNDCSNPSNSNNQKAIRERVSGLLLQRFYYWKAVFMFNSSDLCITLLKSLLNQNLSRFNTTQSQRFSIEPILAFFCLNLPGDMEIFSERYLSSLNMISIQSWVSSSVCCVNDLKMKMIIDNFSHAYSAAPTLIHSPGAVHILHFIKVAKSCSMLLLRHYDYFIDQCVVALREFYCNYRSEFSSVYVATSRKKPEQDFDDLSAVDDTDELDEESSLLKIKSPSSLPFASEIAPVQWEVISANLKILQQLVTYADTLVKVTPDRQKRSSELLYMVDLFQNSIGSKLQKIGFSYGRILNGVEFEIPNSNAMCRFIDSISRDDDNFSIDQILSSQKVSLLDACFWMLSNYNSSKSHFFEILKGVGLALITTVERITYESADRNNLFLFLLPMIAVIPKIYFSKLCKLLLKNNVNHDGEMNKKHIKDAFVRCILDRYSTTIDF